MKRCVSNCKQLDSLPYIMSIGNYQCVRSCPGNVLYQNNTCASESQCKYAYLIESSLICVQACNIGDFVFNRYCMSSCPNNTYVDIDEASCVVSCQSHIYYVKNSQLYCIKDLVFCSLYVQNVNGSRCINSTFYKLYDVCPEETPYSSNKLCVSSCLYGFDSKKACYQMCQNNQNKPFTY